MNLKVFGALKTKMQWHQVRQGILAQNIANAATPGYVGRDMAALKPGDLQPVAPAGGSDFGTVLTNARHIQGNIQPVSSFSGARASTSFEITPEENSVVLEEQMMKLAGNQMDYQAATSLYTSNLGLLRTAIGANR
ncbi:MAG: flagellar basal-body rod protein FlgB [Pseudomonadota bacterium]